MNLNGHNPKRPQTGVATNRNGHKPERSQTETATHRNGHKPERPQHGKDTTIWFSVPHNYVLDMSFEQKSRDVFNSLAPVTQNSEALPKHG